MRKGKFHKGLYKPVNPEKYIQPSDNYMNSREFPEYRSSWELHLYRYCDISPAVKYWSTEYIAIPYISPIDNKQHRYFPDVFIVFINDKKAIIEVKPHKEKNIKSNKRLTEKAKRTYLINTAKWEACKQFAEDKGWDFFVMDEYDLGLKRKK